LRAKLTDNVILLHALAERLLEQEIVDGAEVAAMVSAFQEGRPMPAYTPAASHSGTPSTGLRCRACSSVGSITRTPRPFICLELGEFTVVIGGAIALELLLCLVTKIRSIDEKEHAARHRI
jgi:hypothetical protein